MQVSREDAEALILPISKCLENSTITEVYGKSSDNLKRKNQLLRNLLRQCVNAQERMTMDEESAIKTGLIELVSEETIKKLLKTNLDKLAGTNFLDNEDLDEYDLRTFRGIVRYFKKQ